MAQDGWQGHNQLGEALILRYMRKCTYMEVNLQSLDLV